METSTLDKLYLEWSQFTGARTGREIALAKAGQSVCDQARVPDGEMYPVLALRYVLVPATTVAALRAALLDELGP